MLQIVEKSTKKWSGTTNLDNVFICLTVKEKREIEEYLERNIRRKLWSGKHKSQASKGLPMFCAQLVDGHMVSLYFQ